MKTDSRVALRRFVQTTFLRGSKRYRLTDESKLFADGVVDSLGIFLIVAFMEKEFGVRVSPKDVVLKNFATVSAMARLADARSKKRR